MVRGRIDGASVAAEGTRILQECQDPDPCSSITLEMLLLDILHRAARAASRRDEHHPLWLRRVDEHIRDTFTGPISLNRLAACAGVHPVHVSREFHRRYGCTVGDLVRQLRLQYACDLMSKRDWPLAAIAAEAGFADHSHFVATFRRYLRTTPSRYRRWVTSGRHG